MGAPELVLILLFGLVGVWPLCRICSKAGYSPWLGLLSLATPLGYIALILILAFAEWPIQKTVKTQPVENTSTQV